MKTHADTVVKLEGIFYTYVWLLSVYFTEITVLKVSIPQQTKSHTYLAVGTS